MYTDQDFSGLHRIADAGLRKQAAEYGNLPEFTTGNAAADMGLYFVPGVGEAMSAYEAARNYADTWSDFKRGKVLAGMANLGSGVLNTMFAIPGIGYVGRLGKALFSGGKGVAKGIRGIGRANAQLAREALKREGAKVVRDASGKAINSPWRHPFATGQNRGIASAMKPSGSRTWMDAYRNYRTAMRTGTGKYIPGMPTVIGGQLAAEGIKSYDDNRYEQNQWDWRNKQFDRIFNGYQPHPPSYTPYSSFTSGKEYWEN